MTIENEGKYVHLGDSYDKDWMFIKDDKELQLWMTDGSMDDGDIVVEVKAIYKIKRNTNITFEMEKVGGK